MNFGLTLLILANSGFAADAAKKNVDQLFVLNVDPVITSYPAFLPTGPDTPSPLTQSQVRIVIECALAGQQSRTSNARSPQFAACSSPGKQATDTTRQAPSPLVNDTTYYILHLVYHIGGKPGSIRDSWYVYFHGLGLATPDRSTK